MYNRLAFETSSSPEFLFNQGVQQIKLSQQALRQEVEKRDEEILQLKKKLERLQSENRELQLEVTDYQRHSDKESSYYRGMLDNINYLEQELAMEKSKNDEFRLQVSRVKQELTVEKERVAYLESEHDKANHIIKTLVKKVQQQQQHPQRSPLSQATTTTGAGGLLHNRIPT